MPACRRPGAMIQSYHTLKSQWLIATVVHLAVAIVSGLGGLLGGIGLLVTGPLYALAIAVMYRDVFLNPDSSRVVEAGSTIRRP